MTEPKLRIQAINQIGFVVQDLDKAMAAYWNDFGIGPWMVYTYGPPFVKDTTYKGQPATHHMRIALAHVGDLMFELIQHLDGETVYKDFVEKSGDGVQHLGIFVPKLAAAMAEAEAAGFKVLQSGGKQGVKGDGGYAYLDTEQTHGVTLELIELVEQRYPPERWYPHAP
ncbi:MAG: VOC family protein [Chloroflexota bacterium]